VVNALVQASRYWGMFRCCITWRSSDGLVLLKVPSMSCARRDGRGGWVSLPVVGIARSELMGVRIARSASIAE
jgi:hypothetical protein